MVVGWVTVWRGWMTIWSHAFGWKVSTVGERLNLRIAAHADGYEPDDERWLRQERDLFQDLDAQVGDISREAVVVPGTRGVVESVILALGSAGAFRASVALFRAWLARDTSRRVELTWTVDGREERIVLQGDRIPDATFERLTAIVQDRFEA